MRNHFLSLSLTPVSTHTRHLPTVLCTLPNIRYQTPTLCSEPTVSQHITPTAYVPLPILNYTNHIVHTSYSSSRVHHHCAAPTHCSISSRAEGQHTYCTHSHCPVTHCSVHSTTTRYTGCPTRLTSNTHHTDLQPLWLLTSFMTYAMTSSRRQQFSIDPLRLMSTQIMSTIFSELR